jgi:hypothetical protein
MQRAIVTWLIVAVSASLARETLSDETKSAPSLKGTYLFSGSATCVHAPKIESPTVAKDISSIEYIATHGTRTFNGDGTGLK